MTNFEEFLGVSAENLLKEVKEEMGYVNNKNDNFYVTFINNAIKTLYFNFFPHNYYLSDDELESIQKNIKKRLKEVLKKKIMKDKEKEDINKAEFIKDKIQLSDNFSVTFDNNTLYITDNNKKYEISSNQWNKILDVIIRDISNDKSIENKKQDIINRIKEQMEEDSNNKPFCVMLGKREMEILEKVFGHKITNILELPIIESNEQSIIRVGR